MEREAEIDLIKRELAILRSRYAVYRRTARTVRVIVLATLPVLVIGALISAVMLFRSDLAYGALFLAAVLIFVPAVIWLIRSAELRWIDLATPQIRGIYHPDFFKSEFGSHRRVRSEADITEQQIADRERRLSELGASAAASKPGD